MYQGQWKWLISEEVNTASLFTPALETQGLHNFSIDAFFEFTNTSFKEVKIISSPVLVAVLT